MKILAVDTSSAICSVALLDNDILIDEINLDNGRTHSENLMPLVDEIITRNKSKIKAPSLLGSGAFTYLFIIIFHLSYYLLFFV